MKQQIRESFLSENIYEPQWERIPNTPIHSKIDTDSYSQKQSLSMETFVKYTRQHYLMRTRTYFQHSFDKLKTYFQSSENVFESLPSVMKYEKMENNKYKVLLTSSYYPHLEHVVNTSFVDVNETSFMYIVESETTSVVIVWYCNQRENDCECILQFQTEQIQSKLIVNNMINLQRRFVYFINEYNKNVTEPRQIITFLRRFILIRHII